MSQNTQPNKKPRPQNVPSLLLNDEENSKLFSVIGSRCVSLATAVVQVLVAEPPNYNVWSKKCTGAGCFIKDNQKRSYYIRVYDIQSGSCIWEQELYNQFKYHTPEKYFHTFEADNCPAGLNFSNETEAEKFRQAIEEKLLQRQKRKMERKKAQRNSAMAQQMPATPSMEAMIKPESGKDTLRKKERNTGKSKGKGKLSKEDIGTPSNFRHVGHVGWDPDKGFDMNQMDPDLKALFHRVGISEEQLRDKDTADFIYDFIEKHGGVEAVKSETKRDPFSSASTPAPPPARAVPPPSTGYRPRAAVPPPALPQRGPAAPPPPPPRVGQGVAPPPPPVPNNRQISRPPPPPVRSNPPAVAPPPPPMALHDVFSKQPGRMMAAPPGPPPAPPLPSSAGAPPLVAPPAPPGPPPPPPPGGAPPPPPPGGAPPPPPPPPPPGGMPPPAPSGFAGKDARADLFSEIRNNSKSALHHVDSAESKPANDPHDALLNQIKGGFNLKPVDPAEQCRPAPVDDCGLASALKKALDSRAAKIQDDSDYDVETDGEWEDDY